MASVYVDIPGIGTVEAKNAGSEATLLEILKAIKKQKPGQTVGGGDGGAGGGDGGGGGKSVNALNVAAHNTGLGFKKLTGTVKSVAGTFVGLGEAATQTIEKFANVGDSVENAANVFSSIPLVGTMFGAVAESAAKVTDSFQNATASGATFGGSIQQFAGSASAAGMTMDKFAQLISKNGEALRLLGGDTANGAKRFAAISKTLRTSSNELYNLGYSTEDVNQGMANYTKYLGSTGKLGNQTNAQLASGAKSYLKQMDLLAKVTGESRKDQEDARAKLLNDAQFQGKVANMSAAAGEAFANTVNQLPPGLRDVAKDIMVTGTATTEESQKFMSMMPKSAALMQKYAAITDAGGTITAEMQNELNNMLAAEGKSAKQQYASIGKYNKDMAGVYMNTVQASNIQNDAMKNATKEQKEAAEKQKTMAAAMEKNKQALAELSNTFQMALANSGILDLMMRAFQFLANLVTTYVVPAFNIIAGIVTTLGGKLLDILVPAFEWLGGFLRDTVYPAFVDLAAFVLVDLLPALKQTAEDIWSVLGPALKWIGGFIMEYVFPAFSTIAGFVLDNLTPILIGLGVALGAYSAIQLASAIPAMIAQAAATWALVAPLLAAAAPFILIGVAIAGAAILFKKLGGDMEVLRLGFGMWWEGFKGIFSALKLGFYELLDIIPGLDYSKEIEETKADIKKNAETIVSNAKAIETRMADNRSKAAEEDQKKEDKRKSIKSQMDLKHIKAQGAGTKALEDSNAAQKKALDAKTDMNTADSVALLGQELKSQKSGILPKAEAAKKEIEQKGVAKQAEEAKTQKESAMKNAVAEQEAGKAASPVKTQESSESLLASLNTKLDQLIAVGKGQLEINRNQLSAAQAMSGDLHKMA